VSSRVDPGVGTPIGGFLRHRRRRCNLAVRRRAMPPFLIDLVCAEENAALTASL
jgi:hypothetical protein